MPTTPRDTYARRYGPRSLALAAACPQATTTTCSGARYRAFSNHVLWSRIAAPTSRELLLGLRQVGGRVPSVTFPECTEEKSGSAPAFCPPVNLRYTTFIQTQAKLRLRADWAINGLHADLAEESQ